MTRETKVKSHQYCMGDQTSWSYHWLSDPGAKYINHANISFSNLVTVRNVVAARLCFNKHVSRILSSGGGGVSCPSGRLGMHGQGDTTPPWADTTRADMCPPPRAEGVRSDTPRCRQPCIGRRPPWRPLQRTVRILLECILVLNFI